MDYQPYVKQAQYYETDQMGVIHHSNYIRWFEEARVDFLNQAGAGYREMEAAGIMSPVLSVSCQYKSMVRFGERVEIRIGITGYNGIKLNLCYEVRDAASGEIRCTGESSHCFLGRDGKPISLKRSCPEYHAVFMKCAEQFGTEPESRGRRT